MVLDIKPTRSELINLKRRIKQTKNGYNLLKMKRDGLFFEFRQLLDEMIQAKRDLTETFRLAKMRIDLAQSIEGGLAVQSVKRLRTRPGRRWRWHVGTSWVWSSRACRGPTSISPSSNEASASPGSSPYIDEAADAYGDLIERIVRASEMEATLKRLLEEIEATKRRVNALEFKVIPELEETRVFIQLRLEEMEREETFRLKRFKNK